MNKVFFFSGIVFVDTSKPGIGYDITTVGSRVIIKKQEEFFYFTGIFEKDFKNSNAPPDCGEGFDKYGHSIISDVYFSGATIKFTKCYIEDKSEIHYTLEKDPKKANHWIGIWNRKHNGQGSCRFIIIEVHKDFFLPPK